MSLLMCRKRAPDCAAWAWGMLLTSASVLLALAFYYC